MKLLCEENPRQSNVGHLGRFFCGSCWGEGFEVLEHYDAIPGATVDMRAGILELDSPVEKGERIQVDATPMLVEGLEPAAGGLHVFRVRWVYRPCAGCNGWRVSHSPVHRAAGALRIVGALVLFILTACTAPTREPWHLELVDGVAVVAAGARQVEPLRLPTAGPRPPIFWTWYDQAAWAEVRGRIFSRAYDANR